MSVCVFVLEYKVKLIDVWNNFNNLVCFCISKVFLKKINFFLFFLLQINMFLVFSDIFDMLLSKIIF